MVVFEDCWEKDQLVIQAISDYRSLVVHLREEKGTSVTLTFPSLSVEITETRAGRSEGRLEAAGVE